jgi:hypothetical protein
MRLKLNIELDFFSPYYTVEELDDDLLDCMVASIINNIVKSFDYYDDDFILKDEDIKCVDKKVFEC